MLCIWVYIKHLKQLFMKFYSKESFNVTLNRSGVRTSSSTLNRKKQYTVHREKMTYSKRETVLGAILYCISKIK